MSFLEFIEISTELYESWKASPRLYVIIFGRVIFSIVIIAMIVVIWGILRNLFKRRRY